MNYLVATTILWAFSFSLIGVYLAGQVDAWFSALTRIALAMLLFLPLLKLRSIPKPLALKLMSIGGVQLGLMYCFYYQSFLYLSVPEVLLFTVLTPIYVTLFYDISQRRFSLGFLVSATVAVFGAMMIKYQGINEGFLLGFAVVQGANISFALGQVAYKRVMESDENNQLSQSSIFGLFYIGAFIVALILFILFGNADRLPTTNTQWGILIYLGLVASGLGYFAWNKGATLVSSGSLAVMNNALVPAGLVVNIIIWNRNEDLTRLAIGGGIILFSLWLNHFFNKRQS